MARETLHFFLLKVCRIHYLIIYMVVRNISKSAKSGKRDKAKRVNGKTLEKWCRWVVRW